MPDVFREDITGLLLAWGSGDRDALDRLVPLLYTELRRLASRQMRRERPGHSFHTTALVHEAYLRLVDYKRVQPRDRAHFLAIAAQAMRRILVEGARGNRAAKRGGGGERVPLEDAAAVATEPSADLLALDSALSNLAAFDPRKAQIVELKYFGGLTIEETAEVVGVSTPTVEREWRTARLWLYRAMTTEAGR
jgi:RNA polymerase sigma factor (TIGR02999 family)